MDEDRQRGLALRRTDFLLILMLCVIQGVVPAWGAVLCVGEDGHVAIELTIRCALDTSDDDTCESGRDVNSCPCCISEDASPACNDTRVSPYSLSSGSNVPYTQGTPSGGAVTVTGVHVSASSFVTANASGNIGNPFFIESVTHRSLSSVILLI